MKKTIILLILILFLIPTIFGEISTLGVFKQNQVINLVQTCSNCSQVNITKVQFPNSSILTLNVPMSKDGTDYNYSFSQTDTLGKYQITTCGDVDGILTCVVYDLEITTTGEKVGLSNIILVIVFLLFAIICLIAGYSFATDYWLVKSLFYIGAMLMGVLAINSGKIIASESIGLSTMGNAGLTLGIIMFVFITLYIFIYWTIETIKSIKEKQGVRWKY